MIPIETTKEKMEKSKALKKLIKKWLTTQETQDKADLLIARNPELKIPGATRSRKAS